MEMVNTVIFLPVTVWGTAGTNKERMIVGLQISLSRSGIKCKKDGKGMAKEEQVEKITEAEIYERFAERYAAQDVPWDAELPPPEIMAVVEKQEPGRALDLGCGYGRTTIYLAQHGWRVDGGDFVPDAISEANRRAQEAGVTDRASFHVGSVADLDFLDGRYDLAIDVGCMHALTPDQLRRYHAGLKRLLRPGSLYLLYTRLQENAEQEVDGPRGIPQDEITRLFSDGFTLDNLEIGITEMADRAPWKSAWFWFYRL